MVAAAWVWLGAPSLAWVAGKGKKRTLTLSSAGYWSAPEQALTDRYLIRGMPLAAEAAMVQVITGQVAVVVAAAA